MRWPSGILHGFRPGRRHLPIIAIVAVVLLANGPYLFGAFDSSPALLYSGQGVGVTGKVLAGAPSIDPTYGFQAQALGRRAAVDLLHARLPWWNPYEGIGMPLAGNMQSAALFPLVLLELAPWGLLLSHVILEAAAGVAAYLLLRRLRVSVMPAVAAGCAFGLDGTFSWFGHAPVNVIATLPLALLGVELAREAAGAARTGGWILLALSLALSVYAGFPETAFIDGLLVLAWAAARLPGLSRPAAARFAGKLAGGAVTAGLLAAPLLAAFADDLQGANVGGHGGALGTASVPAAGAVQWGLPYYLGPIFGYIEHGQPADLYAVWGNTGGYLGMALVMLALIGAGGIRSGPYRALRGVLAVWALVCSARVFGAHWAVTLLNLVPGVDRTAFYRYCPPAIELAVAVLAALGLQDLATRPVRARAAWLAGAAAACGAFIAWTATRAGSITDPLAGQPPYRELHLWREASVGWALFGLAALVIAGLLPAPRRLGAMTVVVALDAVVLFAVPEFSAPRSGHIDMAAVTFLRTHLGEQRVLALNGALQPNYGSYFGVAQINDNDSPVPGPWSDYIVTRLDSNADPINFTGSTRRDPNGPSAVDSLLQNLPAYQEASVRYVLVPVDLALPTPLVKVWSDGLEAVFELPGAAPLFNAVGPGCRVTSPDYDTVTASCSSPATLVRRVLAEPGWRAAGPGGLDLDIAAYDGPFQSVRLPAGTTTVHFSFEPPHLPVALVALATGWAVVAAGALGAFGLLGRGRTGSGGLLRRGDRRPGSPGPAGRRGRTPPGSRGSGRGT